MAGRKNRKRARLGTLVPVLHTHYKLEPQYDFGDDTCGLCTSGAVRHIRISATQQDPFPWSATFWHEFFHAAFFELGFMQDVDSEAKVEGLAHAMMTLLTERHGRYLLKDMLKHLPEKQA